MPPTPLQPAGVQHHPGLDLASSSAPAASLPNVSTRRAASMRINHGQRIATRSSARIASMVAAANSVSSRSNDAVSLPQEPQRITTRSSARIASMPVAAARSNPSRSNDIVASAEVPSRRSTSRRKRQPRDELDSWASPAKKRRASLKKPPATLKEDSTEDQQNIEKPTGCCICLCEPKKADLASINGCNHLFCFDCIEKWADRENTCPLCKERFSKIDRVHKRKKSEQKLKQSKRVKQKDQRSDIPQGVPREELIAGLTRLSQISDSILALSGELFRAFPPNGDFVMFGASRSGGNTRVGVSRPTTSPQQRP